MRAGTKNSSSQVIPFSPVHPAPVKPPDPARSGGFSLPELPVSRLQKIEWVLAGKRAHREVLQTRLDLLDDEIWYLERCLRERVQPDLFA